MTGDHVLDPISPNVSLAASTREIRSASTSSRYAKWASLTPISCCPPTAIRSGRQPARS